MRIKKKKKKILYTSLKSLIVAARVKTAGSLLLESKIQPDTAYQKQQVTDSPLCGYNKFALTRIYHCDEFASCH